MNKKKLTKLLSGVGLYKPLRKIYNFIGRHNKTTGIIYNGHNLIFNTPTFYLNDYVLNLAGETGVLNEFLSRINDNDTFWDIGANIGLYSMIIARTKKNTKVFAFEPEKEAFKLLEKNIAGNNITNINCINAALGNNNEEKIIYSSDTPNFGAHSFVQRTDYKLKKKGQSVHVLTADKVIKESIADTPSVIKIDVEGAEILVLEGMTELLKNPSLRIILIEVHNNLLPLFNSSGEAVINMVKSHGFTIDFNSTRSEQNHIIFIR